ALDPSVVHVHRQLQNIDCSRIARNLADDQCLAEIFECSVDCINEQLHRAWLIWAGQHQTGAGFCGEIIRGPAQPLVVESGGACRYLQIAITEPRPGSLVAARIFPASACAKSAIWLAGQRRRWSAIAP